MKWYQERTFKFSFITLCCIGIVFSVASSLHSGYVDLIGLWFVGFALFVLTPFSYFFRRNL